MKVKIDGTVVLEKGDRNTLTNAAALCRHLAQLQVPRAVHAETAAEKLLHILEGYPEKTEDPKPKVKK